MFDTLTLDELYALHAQLCAEVNAIGDRMLNGKRPRIRVLSDQWNLLSAKQGEAWEMAESALAEIYRREEEAVAASLRALHDLRIQRGIDA